MLCFPRGLNQNGRKGSLTAAGHLGLQKSAFRKRCSMVDTCVVGCGHTLRKVDAS